MKWSTRRAAARVGVMAIATGVAFSLLGTSAAYAFTTNRAGDATVTDPTHGGAALASGGQTTTWSLALPPGAACSGTAASNPSYNVYGFIVPDTTDPNTLTYDSINGPSSPGNALFDTSGSQYGPANPAISPAGQVTGIPSFNWNKYGAGQPGAGLLPAGSYRLGIACVKNGSPSNVVDKYWDVQLTFTDGNLNWQATNPTSSVPESPLNVALPLSAVALLGGAAVVMYRRRSRHGDISA